MTAAHLTFTLYYISFLTFIFKATKKVAIKNKQIQVTRTTNFQQRHALKNQILNGLSNQPRSKCIKTNF